MIHIIIFFLFIIHNAFASDFSEANMLYRQAIMLYAEGDYKEAIEKLEEIEKKAPDYPNIKKVIMNEAFFFYVNGQYPEAAAMSDTYVELYKMDNYVPYLYFLKANALQKQKKSPTKEYYLIQKNIDSWNDVIAQNNYMYSQEARVKILELEEMQCLHELKIGDTYLQNQDYFAAIRRFNNVLHCPSDRYNIEASKRLAKSYKAIKLYDQHEKYQNIVDEAYNTYEIPEELTFITSVKNLLFDMVPDLGFLPSSILKTT